VVLWTVRRIAAGSSSLISNAKKHNKDGQFVAIYGQEFSEIKIGNHVNVFEVPNVTNVENGRFDLLLNNWLPINRDSTGQEAILLFHHPAQSDSPNNIEYGRDDFSGVSEWVTAMGKVTHLIDISPMGACSASPFKNTS